MFTRRLAALFGSSFVGQQLKSSNYFIAPRCQIRANSTEATARKINIIKRRSRNVQITQLDSRFNMEWPKVTLFGDSITRRSFDVQNGCWASMIAFELGNYFDVDSRGFEGYNSRWALELMPKLFPKNYLDKVELFIPFFGHNDAFPRLLAVPIEEYEQNMRSIVNYLIENGLGTDSIILITPTWYDHSAFASFCEQLDMPVMEKSLRHSKQYSEAILRIAKDHDISVLDFFDLTVKYQPLAELFCDGIHYSRTGAKLLFDNLMPIIEKKIEQKFGKPLQDLWHVTPLDQIPEIAQALAEYRKSKQ